MLYGVGWIIFGGIISAFSYSIASNGTNGGRYVIATGAMAVGGIQFAFGVFEFCLTEFLSGDVLAEIREAKESNATKLCLHYCKVTDLMPLAELSNLKNLGLSSNHIADLTPLAELTKLEVLELDKNEIKNLTPLAGLSNLRNLDLDDNPIPYEQKAMLKKALPNCKIEFG
jgi:hypothetical protein